MRCKRRGTERASLGGVPPSVLPDAQCKFFGCLRQIQWESKIVSFEYDEETDVISIRISAAPVTDTDEDAPGTIID